MSNRKKTRKGCGRDEKILGEESSIDELQMKMTQQKLTEKDSSGPVSGSEKIREPQTSTSSGVAGAATRGRGGYRPVKELRTIPTNIKGLTGDEGRQVKLLTNFVKVLPKPGNKMCQYQIDIEPNIESKRLRRQILLGISAIHFNNCMIFDGAQGCKSLYKLPDVETIITVPHPVQGANDGDQSVRVKLRFTNEIDMGSFEMLSHYNTSMRQFMIFMGFFQIRRDFYHNDFRKDLPGNHGISVIGGFRTATNRHNAGLLMNLDAVNKYMQQRNCLHILRQVFRRSQEQGLNFHEAARAELSNAVVITRYNNKNYRIEDVLVDKNPTSKFVDNQNRRQTFMEYYQRAWPNVQITDDKQPLFLARPDRRPGPRDPDRSEPEAINLVPELCYMTSLTLDQQNNSRLRQDMIRYSQVPPADRLNTVRTFLRRLHTNPRVNEYFQNWGISYGKDVLSTVGRVLVDEPICWGNHRDKKPETWPRCFNGSFDNTVRNSTMYGVVHIKQLHVISSKPSQNVMSLARQKIPQMLKELGVNVGQISEEQLIEGRANLFARACRSLPQGTSMALVVLPSSSKDIYDAVKKTLTKELGIPSQCVTQRLLGDDRKVMSACKKIAIQMACKIGGEPWILNIPIHRVMICGYDTYHDTSKKGRSVGAFVSSTNQTYSRWWSKTDTHQQLEELSNNLSSNLLEGCIKYREANKALPERIILYRDGVSDGQLDHVYNVELTGIQRTLQQLRNKGVQDIKLTVVIVTKRVGARFFLDSKPISNPQPGTVVDKDVTRAERYEFYLVSPATRQGTVAPTLYNIICDYSGLQPNHHQMLAYKLCHLYYNWTGTVRVPAPCQYAHKLAQLVGEHIHESPNSRLNTLLHYL